MSKEFTQFLVMSDCKHDVPMQHKRRGLAVSFRGWKTALDRGADLPLCDPLLLVIKRGVPSELGELGNEVCGCGCSRMSEGENGMMVILR